MKSGDLPLAGIRVLVTRAEHQAGELTSQLQKLGATSIEMPVIEIGPPDSWDELDNAIANLNKYNWIIFASANAVRSFSERLSLSAKLSGSLQYIGSNNMPAIAVIGETTAKAAQEAGFKVDYKPDIFIAESFIEQFPGYPNLNGTRVLWPRTNIGRNYILEKFTDAGAKIDLIAAYKTSLPKNIDQLKEKLHQLIKQKEINAITLASAKTATNLAEILNFDSDASSFDELLHNILLVSIGPETSAQVHKCFGKVDLEADPHNVSGIIAALVKHFYKDQK